MSKRNAIASFYLLLFAVLGAVLAIVPRAYAGVMVSVNLVPSVLSFSPGSAEYIFSLAVNASGFTDDANHGNYILLKSNDGAFSGDYFPATGSYSGTAGSNGYGSVADLNAAINSTGGFTLALTDGLTGKTSKYSLSIGTPGINPDFVRAISLTPGPNTTIPSNATFTLAQPSSSNPAAQYTSGYYYLNGNSAGNNPTTTPFSTTGTSFSPVSPLAPDAYTAGVYKSIDFIDPSIFNVTAPAPLNGAAALGSFDYAVSATSNSQSDNLTVVPEPSALVFLAAIGVLAARRRRA
jgi:hypothetical protein